MYEIDTITLILSLVLTWGIGLTPPILIRYIFFKRSIARWLAVGICTFLWLSNIFLFTALGSKSKTHAVLFIIAFVSYFILRYDTKPKELIAGKPLLMPVKQYAKRYGVTEQKVIDLIMSGHMKGEQQNGVWYIFQ